MDTLVVYDSLSGNTEKGAQRIYETAAELGIRPIFHQVTERVTGHLFISVLAYHLNRSAQCRFSPIRRRNHIPSRREAIGQALCTHSLHPV